MQTFQILKLFGPVRMSSRQLVSDGDMVRSLGELEVSSEKNWGTLRDVQDRVKLSIGCYH